MEKEIEYWIDHAVYDLETAEVSKNYLQQTKELFEWLKELMK